MLRLTVSFSQPTQAVLRVEGWVDGPGAGLLEREGMPLLRLGAGLTVDLAGARFIDHDGLALLDRWRRCGVRVRGGSPFIRALLTGAGEAAPA